MLARIGAHALSAVLAMTAFAAEGPDPSTMTTLTFALLRAEPAAAPAGERTIQRIQEAHLAWLAAEVDAGRGIVWGTIFGDGSIRAAAILDTADAGEARARLARSPWVREGRLAADVYTWWTGKGAVSFPRAIAGRPQTFHLGLLERPPDAPDYPEEKLAEIQRGHLANIGAMAESGALVAAGPFGENVALRGILVFRDGDAGSLRALVARDPAVKAGRLGMRLFPWYVPEGAFPAE